ncbi:hypothetical protein BC938DRAFT_484055, partial [Jimgerdemannia flammicorona]
MYAPPVPVPVSRGAYIFRVGETVKKIRAGNDVEISRLKDLFSLSYEPRELTDSQDISITKVRNTTGVDVFPSAELEAGETYDIVEPSAQVPSDFNIKGQERRVEVALWLCRALYEDDPGDLKYLVAFSDDELEQSPQLLQQ